MAPSSRLTHASTNEQRCGAEAFLFTHNDSISSLTLFIARNHTVKRNSHFPSHVVCFVECNPCSRKMLWVTSDTCATLYEKRGVATYPTNPHSKYDSQFHKWFEADINIGKYNIEIRKDDLLIDSCTAVMTNSMFILLFSSSHGEWAAAPCIERYGAQEETHSATCLHEFRSSLKNRSTCAGLVPCK